MHIRFTNHAKWRIDEREISIVRIEQTLKTPDIVKQGFNGTSVACRMFAGKNLEVVDTKGKRDVVVITAYYL